LLCSTSAGAAHAQSDLTFLNYDTGQSDNLIIGMVEWFDGNEYVTAYDRNACTAHLGLRNGLLAMLDGLDSHVVLKTGDGSDVVIVHSQNVPFVWGEFVVGGAGGICPNLPRMTPLVYNGWLLALKGGGYHDTLVGGEGFNNLYGEGGNDTLWPGLASTILNGGTGHDQIFGTVASDNVQGGSGRDIFQDLGGWSDIVSMGSSDDCVIDTSGFSSVDCGTGESDALYATGWINHRAIKNCGLVSSTSACYDAARP
jgi:Ca2+-binding RTX toxin-like protein